MIAYSSLAYYSYLKPKNIHRINPLCMNSLNTIDFDYVQDVFGKNFKDKRSIEEREKIMREIIIIDSPEIKEIKKAIEHEKVNKIISRQMGKI